MKLLQVNYRRDRGQGDPEQAEHLLGAAERISGLPGLQWKIWIYDDQRRAAGGIYLFDTEEHARRWGDEMLPNSLGRLPGVSEIEKRYFDVDERLSAITRGPVAVSQAV
ncbi:MAG: YdhR family protein [Solirubrobacterales bacterium]|nr:YdhR family protein [Solirubrobacterales bacterium]